MLKNLNVALPVVCCVLVLASAVLRAQDEEPNFNVNPFSEGDEANNRATATISDEPASSFSLPSLPTLPKPSLPKFRVPSWNLMSGGDPGAPSTWDKINGGAKTFFAKTKRTLMPWADDSASQLQPRTAMRSRRGHRTASRTKRRSDEKSFFSSLFSPKEEEDQIETVNEFLALPPVPYE